MIMILRHHWGHVVLGEFERFTRGDNNILGPTAAFKIMQEKARHVVDLRILSKQQQQHP
jgi:hypothetical protein